MEQKLLNGALLFSIQHALGTVRQRSSKKIDKVVFMFGEECLSFHPTSVCDNLSCTQQGCPKMNTYSKQGGDAFEVLSNAEKG